MTISLPQLAENASDAETVATLRAAAIFLRGEMQRALAGQCIGLAGAFRNASESVYRAADLIERSSPEALRSVHREELERAERALSLVAAWLNWPELQDYMSALAYRRTGIRPQAKPRQPARRRARGTPRYVVAELVPSIAPVPFEGAFSSLREAERIFRERAKIHRLTVENEVPMILADRRRGVVLKSVGDLDGIDLTHHAVNGVLTLQTRATI
jgi:hypothetical protein